MTAQGDRTTWRSILLYVVIPILLFYGCAVVVMWYLFPLMPATHRTGVFVCLVNTFFGTLFLPELFRSVRRMRRDREKCRDSE